MGQSIRTFVAVDVPCGKALRPVLSRLAGMGRMVRAVSPDNLHITLKFLGDVAAERTVDIAATVETAVASLAPFDSELVGLGAFPHTGRPSVIWVGLTEPLLWKRLAEQVEAALEAIGFPREGRGFEPHVTLARVKGRPPGELRTLLDAHAATPYGVTRVERVVLYQSELSPAGSRYTALATASLRG